MNTISSLLNFIGGKIGDLQSPEEFTLTRTASASTGSGYGVYDKVSKIVRINFFFGNGDTGISVTANIFTIPEKYRPSETKYGTGMVYTGAASSKAAAGCLMSAKPNGGISQTHSNNTTRGAGYIEYILD